MMDKVLQKSAELPKEILNPFSAAKQYSIEKYQPCEPLENFIECYWVLHWDPYWISSTNPPYVCEVLPSPYINMTFMPRGPRITGIPKGKLSYELKDISPILGVQFKPGGFYPFWQQSVHQLTDTFIAAGEVFFEIDNELNTQLLAMQDSKIALKHIEGILLKQLPQQDKNIERIGKIIEDATSVDNPPVTAIADKYSMSVRSLQELFKHNVGVGLKWIILRNRLQKAVQRTIVEESPNWSLVAVDLGYVDQSHFINDFKRVIGVSPKNYLQILRSSD